MNKKEILKAIIELYDSQDGNETILDDMYEIMWKAREFITAIEWKKNNP
jgi:hypothetical protein